MSQSVTERAAMEFSKSIPIQKQYDLVVCGGGPSGVPAALAAARAGLKVLVVESTGQLGGVGTSAGVCILLGGRSIYDASGSARAKPCVRGIFQEVCNELIARGAGVDPDQIPDEKYPAYGWYKSLAHTGFTFDPIPMVALLDELMLKAGVDVLFFTQFVDVRVAENKVQELILVNKSGLFAVKTRAVVDSTGDADVAARSGCAFVKGRKEDGLMTPATLMFVVDNVDQEQLTRYIYEKNSPRLRELIQSLREKGEWPFPFDIFISLQTPERGMFMINTSRICDVDGTNGVSVTNGMMRGRKEVHQLFKVMRKHLPGFANSRMINVAPVLGVRETRRIVADYTLSVNDVLAQRAFADCIGYSGYCWDLPDPKRPSFQPMHENKVAPPRLTPIPYRTLVPRPITNVICPGRAISIERDVMGPLRVMAPCYAMGEAAGVASIQVVLNNVAYKDVDVARLRAALRANGCVVDAAQVEEEPAVAR